MPILTYKNKQGDVLEIVNDTEPEDPRQLDNVGIMLCAHKRANFGDMQFNSVDALEQKMKELKPVVKLPLYLMDHSGYAIRTTDFNDPWDSGQLGWIIATKKSIKKMYDNKKLSEDEIKDILISEVKTYDDYLRGNVYGYRIIKSDEITDSCYGYYCEPEDIVNELGKGWIEV